MKRPSMAIMHKLHVEGPQRLLLIVGIPYSASGPTISVAHPVDEILIRAAHRGEFGEYVPAAVCWSCEAMNVMVRMRDDDEIENHRKIHEAITEKVRYEKR